MALSGVLGTLQGRLARVDQALEIELNPCGCGLPALRSPQLLAWGDEVAAMVGGDLGLLFALLLLLAIAAGIVMLLGAVAWIIVSNVVRKRRPPSSGA